MSQSNAEIAQYKWEWPADRKPQTRILIKVTKLEKQGEGFLGIKKSPSIATNLPDAMILEGTVVQSDTGISVHTVELTVPKVEIPDIAVGDKVALGFIANKVCICAEKLPDSVEPSNEANWLADWNCIK